jgi:hypothetical protein
MLSFDIKAYQTKKFDPFSPQEIFNNIERYHELCCKSETSSYTKGMGIFTYLAEEEDTMTASF